MHVRHHPIWAVPIWLPYIVQSYPYMVTVTSPNAHLIVFHPSHQFSVCNCTHIQIFDASHAHTSWILRHKQFIIYLSHMFPKSCTNACSVCLVCHALQVIKGCCF